MQVSEVPVLPGFDEVVAFHTDNRSAGDVHGLARLFVAEVGGPVHADEIVFGEGNNGCYAKVGELGTKIVEEGEELAGTVEVAWAIV